MYFISFGTFCALTLVLVCSGEGNVHSSYRAAVLELVQFDDTSFPPREVLKRNLDVYDIAAKTASKHNVDIIVFPECGLYPWQVANRSVFRSVFEDIPDPRRKRANPCRKPNPDQPLLRRLSCMARDNGLYLVANLVDAKGCAPDSCDAEGGAQSCRGEPQCPDDGLFLYNTNVVFDRDGTLVARYYKRHLYFEKEMNVPHFEEDGYFETDFGRFITVVCFDLVFKEAVEDVERLGAPNVAYPTYWFDHVPPVFFASAYQQAWAVRNRVNLLAANGHRPATGTLGSGIFAAERGALVYTHNPDGRTKLLIANVNTSGTAHPSTEEEHNNFRPESKRFYIENGEAIEDEDEEEDRDFAKECGTHVLGDASTASSDYRCHPPSKEHYKFVKLEGRKGEIEACSNNFCCSLRYSANSMNENYFLGISGNDLEFYDTFSYGVQTCFLVRCEPHGGLPCWDYVLQSHTVFRNVELVGNFTAKYTYPFAVNSEVRLTDKRDWKFDGKSSIVYHNSKKVSSLMFLGLYGRFYEKDKVI